MSTVVRRFAGPAVGFLFGLGLELSGYENLPLAITIWAIAGTWSIWAVATYAPVNKGIRNIRRIKNLRIVVQDKPKVETTASPQYTKGPLDFVADSNLALNQLIDMYKRFTKDAVTFGENSTPFIRRIDKTADPVTRRSIATQFATKVINKYAEKTAQNLPPFQKASDELRDNWAVYIRDVDLSTEQDYQSLETLKGSIEDFMKANVLAKKGVESAFNSVQLMRKRSLALDQAGSNLAAHYSAMIEVMARLDMTCNDVISVVKDRQRA